MEGEIYKSEALELLDELEAALLELEEAPEDQKLVNRIFRALHTIKGGGQMFGFDEVAAFTHDIETAYDAVREGKLAVGQELVSLTLASRDVIRRMVLGEPVDSKERTSLIQGFQEIQVGKAQVPEEPAGLEKNESSPPEGRESIYRIRFKPASGIFTSGTNVMGLFKELQELGECTVICTTREVPGLPELDAESCYLAWEIILTTRREENAIRDVFIFVEDESVLEIRLIAEGITDEQQKNSLLGEILVAGGDLTPDRLVKVLSQKPLLGEILVTEKEVDQCRIDAALAEQQHVRKLTKTRQEMAAVDSVRVAAEKLDTLVDLVGELVIVQARLSQHAATTNDGTAVFIAEEVERLTAELRDNTMSLRMVQIGTIFSRFKRLVRDLSKELTKEIELAMEGGETELDKTVIEKLNDPLVHIIRNSIDHGIESPEERAAAGKEKTGTIRLTAVHSGANVVIAIADDGAGLDAAKIKAKAAEKGLLAPTAEVTDEEAFQLIFEPGFSTSRTVNDISGRGVGMDVVRRGVESLRGSIEVSSRPGEGTEIAITLPLTMAIIDGLLVETGGEKYVIPQAAVIECFAQTREDIEKAHGNHVIEVREHMLPYICLRERFGIGGDIPASRRVVLCEATGREIGLAVDRVLGSYQTVIKPLGDVCQHVECVSGATILGDGTVALILDPGKLVHTAEGQAGGKPP